VFNNNTNHNDEETSFTEAYKSQILNDPDEEENESILAKLLITLLIIAIVSSLSIYGYKTFIESEKVVTEPSVPQESLMIDNIDDLTEDNEDGNQPPASKSLDSVTSDSKTEEQKMEDDIKLEISKEMEEKENTIPEKLTTSTQKGEDKYLEQLAELSKEIDGEEE